MAPGRAPGRRARPLVPAALLPAEPLTARCPGPGRAGRWSPGAAPPAPCRLLGGPAPAGTRGRRGTGPCGAAPRCRSGTAAGRHAAGLRGHGRGGVGLQALRVPPLPPSALGHRGSDTEPPQAEQPVQGHTLGPGRAAMDARETAPRFYKPRAGVLARPSSGTDRSSRPTARHTALGRLHPCTPV